MINWRIQTNWPSVSSRIHGCWECSAKQSPWKLRAACSGKQFLSARCYAWFSLLKSPVTVCQYRCFSTATSLVESGHFVVGAELAVQSQQRRTTVHDTHSCSQWRRSRGGGRAVSFRPLKVLAELPNIAQRMHHKSPFWDRKSKKNFLGTGLCPLPRPLP